MPETITIENEVESQIVTLIVENPIDAETIEIDGAQQESISIETEALITPKEVTFRFYGGFVQWKYVGDPDWNNLFEPGGSSGSPSSKKIIDQSIAAIPDDANHIIYLDGTDSAVNYTIDPGLLVILNIKCINADHPVKVYPFSGTIDDQAFIEFNYNESARIFADGNDLKIV